MKTTDSYFISWCSRYYISSALPHRQYLKIFSLKMHKRTPLGGNDWDSAKYLSIPQDVLTALVFPQHTKGGWGSALVHCVQHGKGTHFLLFLPQRNLPIINWRQRKKPHFDIQNAWNKTTFHPFLSTRSLWRLFPLSAFIFIVSWLKNKTTNTTMLIS